MGKQEPDNLEYTGNPGIEINGKMYYPENGDIIKLIEKRGKK